MEVEEGGIGDPAIEHTAPGVVQPVPVEPPSPTYTLKQVLVMPALP